LSIAAAQAACQFDGTGVGHSITVLRSCLASIIASRWTPRIARIWVRFCRAFKARFSFLLFFSATTGSEMRGSLTSLHPFAGPAIMSPDGCALARSENRPQPGVFPVFRPRDSLSWPSHCLGCGASRNPFRRRLWRGCCKGFGRGAPSPRCRSGAARHQPAPRARTNARADERFWVDGRLPLGVRSIGAPPSRLVDPETNNWRLGVLHQRPFRDPSPVPSALEFSSEARVCKSRFDFPSSASNGR